MVVFICSYKTHFYILNVICSWLLLSFLMFVYLDSSNFLSQFWQTIKQALYTGNTVIAFAYIIYKCFVKIFERPVFIQFTIHQCTLCKSLSIVWMCHREFLQVLKLSYCNVKCLNLKCYSSCIDFSIISGLCCMRLSLLLIISA